jgi:hypothetical protein
LDGIEIRYNATNANFKDECSLVTSPITGQYKCYEGGTDGWSSSGARQGWYNATVNATKSFYWNNITTKSDQGPGQFYLYIVPTLTGITVSPSTGGWAINRSFSVNVSDDLADASSVYLWQRSSGGTSGQWQQIPPTKTCEGCTNSPMTWGNVSYNCSFVGGAGTLDYKFNTTDLDGNKTEVVSSTTIEADQANVENITPYVNAVLNRSKITTFTVKVYDRDNLTYPNGASGKAWITTTDIATWDSGSSLHTNSSGYLNRVMSPVEWGCGETYVLGPHKWKSGTDEDSCPTYLKNNVTPEMSFTLVGDLINKMDRPNGTANFTLGETI